jgi:hypothetical protein
VRFDAGDYLEAVFDAILSGELTEGETFKVFTVGETPSRAKFCDATPEQQAAMDDVYVRIAAGEFAEDFGAIKSEAYGF